MNAHDFQDQPYVKQIAELRAALEALVTFVEWHRDKRHLPVHMNTPNTGALARAKEVLAAYEDKP